MTEQAPVVTPTPPVAPVHPVPQPETFTREYVQELRAESASYRTRANEAKAALEAAEAAKTAAEASAAETVSKAEQAANERVIRAELKAVAIKAGMVDLDGLKLADLSTVTLDDKGDVQGADALMTALKEAKPYLFGATGTTTYTGSVPTPKAPEPKSAKDMTKAEYEAAKKAALRA